MGKQPPVFSVILATFNREQLLLRAIQSVLSQTFEDFELIVVDDASADDTHKVVAALDDQRIRYLRQSQNSGVGYARNLGISSAIGEYVAFVDDDDTIASTFLAEVYSVFSHAPSTVGFLWTWKEVVLETESGIQKLSLSTYEVSADAPQAGTNLLRKPSGGSGGLVVRALALQMTGGFNTELRAVGDTELIIRLAKNFDYIVIPQPLYRIFTAHGERLTTPSLLHTQAYERIIELHYDLLRQYPANLSVMYKGCARMYYQIGDRSKARFYIQKLIRYQPFNWRNWMLVLLLEFLPLLPKSVSRRTLGNYYA